MDTITNLLQILLSFFVAFVTLVINFFISILNLVLHFVQSLAGSIS